MNSADDSKYIASLLESALLGSQPKMLYDGEQIMVFSNGSKNSFRCECGCNVFTKKIPTEDDPPNTVKLQCNSCLSFYSETDE